MTWGGRRQLAYGAGVFAVLFLVFGSIGFYLFYSPPSCFDGAKNQDELDIDCGGACQKICPNQITKPVVVFSRAFQVSPGNYSLLAYVDNPNIDAGVKEAPYKFTVYDSSNTLIAERSGTTFLSPQGITPVFESNIQTASKIPARTFFEFDPNLNWFRADPVDKNKLVASQTSLKNPESRPRIDATLSNNAVTEAQDVEVVTIIFNARGNALGASRTEIESIPARSQVPLVFTWPYPFQKEIESCAVPVDVMLVLDTSGSMNDDEENPPQPITFAKNAARDFVNRLVEGDGVGFATFATNGNLITAVTQSLSRAAQAIEGTIIEPKEETGSTNMGDGIAKALEAFKGASSDRRKVLIALTDGLSNTPNGVAGGEKFAKEKADEAKLAGITVYTVGLGAKVNTEFLKSLATDPKKYYHAAQGKDLDRIYKEISGALCERGPARIEIIPRSPHDITWKAGN